MQKKFSAQQLVLIAAFALGLFATGVFGQSTGGPASGPPAGNPAVPVHTGVLYQRKHGVIGANDIGLWQFYRDRLKVYQDPITKQLGICAPNGDGTQTCDWAMVAHFGDVSRDILGPAISKRGMPHRYHVELSRVSPPRGPDFCESLDTDPPCSVDVSVGTAAPTPRTLHILNRDIIDAFCGDEDGCRVMLGIKNQSSIRIRQTNSLGIQYLTTNDALFNRCVNYNDRIYCRSRYDDTKRMTWTVSNGASGVHGNTVYLPAVVQIANRCLFTDADQLTGTSMIDSSPYFSLANQGGDPQGISVCVLDIWDE